MKIKYIIALSFILCLGGLCSCNDSFMNQEPITNPIPKNYFTSESDVKLALNAFYPYYIRGYDISFGGFNLEGSFGGGTASYPRNIPSFHITQGDLYTDNMVKNGSDIDSRYNGKYVTPTQDDGKGNTGWNFLNVYRINWFLENFRKTPISEELKRRYEGEARFFKAWEYYQKVLYFGDVQWLTKALNTSSPELTMQRTPRAEVMDSVLYCLDYAIKYLPEVKKQEPNGRINKDHAYALKSRICLFEGTFRKYHTELNLVSSAKKYLQAAADASKFLIESGRYELYKDPTPETYRNLFIMKGMISHKEAILARVYNGNIVGSYGQRYWNQNNNNVSVTKGLVDEYLCIDGQPIYTGGSPGSYVKNPLFKGYDKWSEMDNRDPRLRQTVMKPGEYVSIYNHTLGEMDIVKYGITYPNCAYGGNIATGYRAIKHWMGDPSQDGSDGTQIGMEIRYAEILLNYVEALFELNGTVGNDVLDLTVNALRSRAGFDFTTYPNSKLSVSNVPADPRLDAIYQEKLGYKLHPLLREIRRERRIELAIEDMRYPDLMRWKAGPLLTVPLRGINFKSVENIYDGTHSSKPEIAPKVIIGKDVYLDSEGFIICYPLSDNLGKNGVLPWGDYQYYWPIPTSEFLLNPNLKPNPGWKQ